MTGARSYAGLSKRKGNLMIELNCRKDKTGTPIIRDVEIADYAEAVIADYKPSALEEPKALDSLHFLESYLGTTVDYQDIYYEEGQSPIAGATVFNNEKVKVFDRDNLTTRIIDVAENTVLIDRSTLDSGNEGYLNFTGFHEGGHVTLHPAAYRRCVGQMLMGEVVTEGTQVVCCRRDTMMKRFPRGTKWIPELRREHQANVFAAYAEMPRQTFVPYATDLIKDAGFYEGVFIEGDDYDWEWSWAIDKIADQLAASYRASRTAVKVHMKNLKLLMKRQEYLDLRAQEVAKFYTL